RTLTRPGGVTAGCWRSGLLEDVDVTDRADADHVGESGPGPQLLTNAGFAAQLSRDLADLPDPRWTDGMAHRYQAARRADRAPAADIKFARLQQMHDLAVRTPPRHIPPPRR